MALEIRLTDKFILTGFGICSTRSQGYRAYPFRFHSICSPFYTEGQTELANARRFGVVV